MLANSVRLRLIRPQSSISGLLTWTRRRRKVGATFPSCSTWHEAIFVRFSAIIPQDSRYIAAFPPRIQSIHPVPTMDCGNGMIAMLIARGKEETIGGLLRDHNRCGILQ